MRTRLLLPLLALAAAAAPARAQTHLLVVSGLGGEPAYAERFRGWATSLAQSAVDRHGVPADRVVVLTAEPDRDPGRVRGRSTRDGVLEALSAFSSGAGPADPLLVVLIGHGSSDGETSRINLPGPDLTAEELAAALEGYPGRPVAVVNAASASGGFVERLAGEGRVVVTATRSPFERNETMFGGYFVEAYADDGADADKDGRVSLLEAFEYARREVERRYRDENRLQTEHALLDDDGDGQGSGAPAADGDGRLAARLFLSDPAAAAARDAPPELRALLERQRALQAEVEALRARRDSLGADEYGREMERLLLEVARVGQAIREQGGGR